MGHLFIINFGFTWVKQKLIINYFKRMLVYTISMGPLLICILIIITTNNKNLYH